MSTELYETIAQGARYWFLFLMVIIVLRCYFWLMRDRKERRRRLRLLPDAGFVGELVVLSSSSEELQEGDELPLPCEGFIGKLRTCDVVVPEPSIGKRHAWFSYERNRGVLIEPLFGKTLKVDGATIENRRQTIYLKHGSRLTLGECELRLRMFAGFEASGKAKRQRLAGDDDAQSGTAALAPAPLTQEQLILAQQQLLLRQQAMLAQQSMRWQKINAQQPSAQDDSEYGQPQDQEPIEVELLGEPDESYTAPTSRFGNYLPPVDQDDGGMPKDDEEEWQYLPYPVDQNADYDDPSLYSQPERQDYVGYKDHEKADKLVWNRLPKRGRRE